MHKIDGDGHVAGAFTEGNPLIPTPATQITGDWLNDVQGELVSTIEGLGGTLVKGSNQLLARLNVKYGRLDLANTWAGNQSVGGTLGVTGATTLASTLGVTGATTLSSTLAVTGNTSLGGTLAVTATSTFSGPSNLNGTTTVNSTFTVATGNATTLNGGVTVTNGTTNGAGVTTAGNGTGAGVVGTGGATNGAGVTGAGVGTGDGLTGNGGSSGSSASTGVGVRGTGGGSGPGVRAVGGTGGGDGLVAVGGGSAGRGINVIGGTGQAGALITAGTSATAAVPQTALRVAAGHLAFEATTSPNSNVAMTNTLTPANIVKAWATITTNNSTTPVVNDAFNVSSVTISATDMTITFASGAGFATGVYACVYGCVGGGLQPFSGTKAAGSLVVRVYSTPAAGNLNLQTNTGTTIDVICTGRQ